MAGRGQVQQQQGKGKGGAATAGRPPKWEKVVQGDLPPFWEPKREGESVEGPITQIRPGQFGKVYTIQEKKGKVSLKNHSMLDGILEGIEPGLKKGDLLRVTFTGEQTGANGKYMVYEVSFARTQAPF